MACSSTKNWYLLNSTTFVDHAGNVQNLVWHLNAVLARGRELNQPIFKSANARRGCLTRDVEASNGLTHFRSSVEVFLFVFPLDFNDFLSSFTLTCCLRPFLIGFMLSFILSCPGCSAGKAKCGSKWRRSRRVKKIEGSLGRVAQWQHSLVFTLLLLSRRLLFCSILWIKTWLEIKSLTRDLVSSAVRR